MSSKLKSKSVRKYEKYERMIDEIGRRADREVQRHKDELSDRFILVYMVNLALAVYDVYGYMPTRIQKIVEAFNRRIDQGQTLEDAMQELEDKTGIVYRFID